jgi:hypothetical protein
VGGYSSPVFSSAPLLHACARSAALALLKGSVLQGVTLVYCPCPALLFNMYCVAHSGKAAPSSGWYLAAAAAAAQQQQQQHMNSRHPVQNCSSCCTPVAVAQPNCDSLWVSAAARMLLRMCHYAWLGWGHLAPRHCDRRRCAQLIKSRTSLSGPE